LSEEGQKISSLDFSIVLYESFCDGLKNTLGEGVMQVIIFHLQLARSEKIDNIEQLDHNLRSIFDVGAVTLEKIMVKELFRKLNAPYKGEDSFDFVRYVDLARKFYEEEKKETELK